MRSLIFLLSIALFVACNGGSSTGIDGVDFEGMTPEELKTELARVNDEIRSDINSGDLYLERARIYESAGNYQSALADIDRAIKLDGKNSQYLLAKGEMMIGIKDFQQAENAFYKCAQIDRENVDCRLKLAEYYFYVRKFKDAMAWTNQALRIDAYDADAYFLKGMIHMTSGDSSLAQSSFQTAIEQNPDFFEAYFELASILASQGSKLALDYYDNCIRLKPERVEAYYNKGLLSQELGMYNEALQAYSELLKVDPNYKEAHFNMGYVNMYYLREYNQGSVHFSNAIRVAPDYYQAYYNRGYCYELLGDVQRALIDYNNALQINPQYTLAAEGKSRVTIE